VSGMYVGMYYIFLFLHAVTFAFVVYGRGNKFLQTSRHLHLCRRQTHIKSYKVRSYAVVSVTGKY
jgi:hypothetical protein